MENLEIVWKDSTVGYGTMYNGFIGRWRCFSIVWDSLCSKDNPKKYKLVCKLPGIRSNINNFISEEVVKGNAQLICDIWIDGLKEE